MLESENLEAIRREIDEIDGRMLRLLSRRAQLALRAGQVKLQAGLPITDGTREQEVLDARVAVGAPPLPSEAVKAIFSEIIGWCRYIQEHNSTASEDPHNPEDEDDGDRHG